MGESLIEITVAIVLLGTIVVGLLGGIFTLVKVADLNTQKTRASIALQSYAEQVKQPATPTVSATYVPCATTASYPAYSGIKPVGYDVTVLGVKYLSGYSGSPAQPQWTTTGCTTANDKGLQQVTLLVDSGPRNHRVYDTIVILKRNTKCPVTYNNADLGPC